MRIVRVAQLWDLVNISNPVVGKHQGVLQTLSPEGVQVGAVCEID